MQKLGNHSSIKTHLPSRGIADEMRLVLRPRFMLEYKTQNDENWHFLSTVLEYGSEMRTKPIS